MIVPLLISTVYFLVLLLFLMALDGLAPLNLPYICCGIADLPIAIIKTSVNK